MEPLLFDIQRTVDHLHKEIAAADSPEEKFELGREAATYQWQLDLMAYHKAEGREFFNFAGWQRGRCLAMISWMRSRDLHRRKMGDLEILERLASVSKSERREGDYHLTRARCKVMAAVVRLATESGMVYCSYAGLARKAGVSERTACSVRSELEGYGVLVRVRTGGRNANGENQSNKYYVRWNALRELLGIENRWEERRAAEGISRFRVWAMLTRRVNPYFNYEGFAHFSKSERQKRRVAKRAREAEQRKRLAGALAVETLTRKESKKLPRFVENPEKQKLEQGFCALTNLSTLKKSFIYQPGRSFLLELDPNVENSTRQSRSSDGSPSGCTWCFDLASFQKSTLDLLGKVNPQRLNPFLNEIDQMTRESPTPGTEQEMQAHAESLVHLLADADKSLCKP